MTGVAEMTGTWAGAQMRRDRAPRSGDRQPAETWVKVAVLSVLGALLCALLFAVLGGVIGGTLGHRVGERAGDAAQAAGEVCSYTTWFLPERVVVDCGEQYADDYAWRVGLNGVLAGLVAGVVVGYNVVKVKLRTGEHLSRDERAR